jgi:predicted RNA binding protein YcfA (HicA-like mRNA interferase family)
LPKQVTPREIIKVLAKLGFKQTRITGSHHRFAHPDGRKVSVPIHGNEPIGKGLLLKIIKQDLKMEKEEFLKIME